MKIAFNFMLQNGPYGGGNSVIQSLADLLPEAGHVVAWPLNDDDIDIIILTNPSTRSPNAPAEAVALPCRDTALRGRIGGAARETAVAHFGLERMNLSFKELVNRVNAQP